MAIFSIANCWHNQRVNQLCWPTLPNCANELGHHRRLQIWENGYQQGKNGDGTVEWEVKQRRWGCIGKLWWRVGIGIGFMGIYERRMESNMILPYFTLQKIEKPTGVGLVDKNSKQWVNIYIFVFKPGHQSPVGCGFSRSWDPLKHLVQLPWWFFDLCIIGRNQYLVGGLENDFYFSIQLGMPSSQLIYMFQRGWNHQPDMLYSLGILSRIDYIDCSVCIAIC